MLAEAACRDAVQRARLQLWSRQQPAEGPFRAEGARRHGVEADPVHGPLDGKRAHDRQHPGLRGRGGKHECRSRHRVARDDREDLALLLAFDETPPHLAGAVEGAIEDDLHDGVEGVRRKVFGGRQEVSGGVVHELVDSSQLLLDGIDGGVHCLGVADIAAHVRCLAPGLAHQPRRFGNGLGTPAEHGHLGPQARQAQCRGAAEAAAAARDDGRFSLQQIVAKRFHVGRSLALLSQRRGSRRIIPLC